MYCGHYLGKVIRFIHFNYKKILKLHQHVHHPTWNPSKWHTDARDLPDVVVIVSGFEPGHPTVESAASSTGGSGTHGAPLATVVQAIIVIRAAGGQNKHSVSLSSNLMFGKRFHRRFWLGCLTCF